MRIALVCNAYPPEFAGGTERVVAAQARELMAAGHHVRVICGSVSHGGDYRPRLEFVDGVEVERIAKTRVEGSTAHWQFARIVRVVEEAARDFDVVHIHHWASLSGDLVRRIGRHTPVALTLHDHFASCPRFFRVPLAGLSCPTQQPTSACERCVEPLLGPHGPGDLQQRLVDRWKSFRAEIEAAACVICPSEHLKRSLSAEMGTSGERWEVVHHGLCQNLERAEQPAQARSPLTVISFGNRARVKGTLELVQAMAALPTGSVRLVLPGTQVEAGFDDELRAAAGELEIEFPGRFDAAELRAHAQRADLAAFPSRAEESYGLVIEEALALGLPVWVSDRGALGEVLTRCAGAGPLPGGILPAENSAAWMAMLAKLVACPEKLQDARRLVPKQPLLAAAAAQRHLELYALILQRHTAQGT